MNTSTCMCMWSSPNTVLTQSHSLTYMYMYSTCIYTVHIGVSYRGVGPGIPPPPPPRAPPPQNLAPSKKSCMTPDMYIFIYMYSLQTHPHILTHLHVYTCTCTLYMYSITHTCSYTYFLPPPLSLSLPPSLPPSLPLPLYFPLSLSNQSNQIYQKTMSQKRVRSFARSSSQCSGSTPSPTAWRSSTRPWRTCAHTKWPPSSTPTCA